MLNVVGIEQNNNFNINSKEDKKEEKAHVDKPESKGNYGGGLGPIICRLAPQLLNPGPPLA